MPGAMSASPFSMWTRRPKFSFTMPAMSSGSKLWESLGKRMKRPQA